MRTQKEMNAIWVLAFADAGFECEEGPAQRIMLGMESPKDLEVVYREMQRVREIIYYGDIELNLEKYYEEAKTTRAQQP